MQLGHSSPSGPRNLPVQSHQVYLWLPTVGENFSESFFSRAKNHFSIRLRAFFEPNIFALSNPFFPSGYLFINAVPFYFRIISINPIFLGFLSILSFFMISYLFGIYCIDETVVRRSAGFWTIIAQFSTCHNLAVAAVYWLFSLVDFSRLVGLFSNAVFTLS